MLCLPFVLMKRYSIFLVLFMSVLNSANSDENCVYKSTCECVFKNGSVVDLTSLGKQNSYRWGNLTAVARTDLYTYYYNPCFGFSLGHVSCDKEVAACQVSLDRKAYFDIGDVTSVHFLVNNSLKLVYTAAEGRKTTVTLTCSEEAFEPQLTVQGELTPKNYEMTLTSRCACPDLCRTSHLSAGSVLVIIFMIFVVLYLFLGIVHSSLTRGAHGWELIPHYEFWVDFPLLVRDGCVFVVSGCKSETAYERI